ncbi:MAG: GxxExxY protein [Sediminibacterium sp.]
MGKEIAVINTNYKYSELTAKIIGCAMTVHKKLKNGLPERYYHKAMEIECKDQMLSCRSEVEIPVFYKGIDIGKRYCDMIVDNKVILEFKATSFLEPIHLAQALNYLELTNYEIGLLINFGNPSLEFKRLINQMKNHNESINQL